MTTPIADFLQDYQKRSLSRFHMPGHKGEGPLGCERWDVTEVLGADSLYEAGCELFRKRMECAIALEAARLTGDRAKEQI